MNKLSVKHLMKEVRELQSKYGFTQEEATESVVEDLVREIEARDKKILMLEKLHEKIGK